MKTESQSINQTNVANEDLDTNVNDTDIAIVNQSNKSRQKLREAIDDAFLILSYTTNHGILLEADVIFKIVDADAVTVLVR
jgi:hypothetical protein